MFTKILKAKNLSLLMKAISVVFFVTAFTLVSIFRDVPTMAQVGAMLAGAVFIAESMLSVDVSMVVRNIKLAKDATGEIKPSAKK